MAGAGTGKGRVDDCPWFRPAKDEEGPDCLYKESKTKMAEMQYYLLKIKYLEVVFFSENIPFQTLRLGNIFASVVIHHFTNWSHLPLFFI